LKLTSFRTGAKLSLYHPKETSMSFHILPRLLI
jgi:hypothetical protein